MAIRRLVNQQKALTSPKKLPCPGGGDGVTVAKVPQEMTSDATKGPRAVFNVNVSLDSSLDIEKLQKQLELLKRFGAI